MEVINQTYEVLLIGAMVVLAVLIVLSLIRSILGPEFRTELLQLI